LDGAASPDDPACLYGDSIEDGRDIDRADRGRSSRVPHALTGPCGPEEGPRTRERAYHGSSALLPGYQWTHLACDSPCVHQHRQGRKGQPLVPRARVLACSQLRRPRPGGITASRHRGPPQGLVATLRTPGEIETGPLLHPLRHGLGGRHGWGDGLPQPLSTLAQGGGFAPIGQQAVMAYADKSFYVAAIVKLLYPFFSSLSSFL
jgi:hypothetical protein